MDYVKRNGQIANSFYNLGLERAQIRDLTGAAEALKKSLHFNKYQTDARNLLGLIYYEMGEVSDAIVQWVISLNLQPDNNRCDYYLEEIQRKPGRLEAVDQNIKKYNQALWYAQHSSDDLAVLQLAGIVEENPNFVKAHLLLALLYMAHEDYTKAGKSLYRVLQIDKNNPKGQWYMSIVKSHTGRAEIEKRKLANAFSHKQMQDDDVIIPPSYKENTGGQMIVNILIGLALGMAAFFFLVMPAKTKSLNNIHNKEILNYSSMLNEKSMEIDKLTEQLENTTAEKEQAEESLSTVADTSGGIITQYSMLAQILQAYRNDDFKTAVQIYANMDGSLITDGAVQPILQLVNEDMAANGYQVLAELGDQAQENGNHEQAIDFYEKSLRIKPDNPQVIFSEAMVYKSMDQTDKANELFGQIIMNYGNSDVAAKAKEERGY
ncbi:tetratricopeptide repeat protein [Clostridium sp. AM58-1XD]|uniref:tetratricopeptide repeat protein n=1 Tax=Clostridium sp. AM58-1XD TaxID=2292307 RepID=UPI000E54EFDC|nr:tetratricopeptide repeat protein [Clostridium sp. AM58-1XD]